VGTVVAWVAGVSAGVAGVVYLCRQLISVAGSVRRLVHLVDDLVGEPARGEQPARLGVLDQQAAMLRLLTCMDKRLTTVELQLTSNGGDTVLDRVARIAAATAPG